MIRTRFIIVILAAVGLLAFFTPGCDELITEVNEIRTAGHPTADFTASPDSGCAPLTVQFADASSGPVVSWIWNFGDDSDLLTADSAKMDSGVFHTYTSTGSYTVTLTVLDSIDGSDQEIKKRCVIVDWSIGDFEPSVDSGCPGLEVSFSPIDYFGISSWLWDFGDGSGSNDSTPTHVYDSIDQFTVTLTVDGECGQTVLTDSNLIEIVPCPSVYFGADPREGCAPLVVMFTDSSVVDSNEVIDLWSWNFGNSASGSNPIESAEYTAPGVYEVTLTARVAGGGSSSFTDTIRVYDETSADFSASPTEGCYLPSRQFQVKFNNQSSGHVDSLVWHFGDGDTLHNDSSPVHAYVSPGRYMVILEAYG